jgi:thioredoxin 1
MKFVNLRRYVMSKKSLIIVITVVISFLVCGAASADQTSQFDDMLTQAKKAGKPVMIDFGSVNCPDCVAMAPILKRLEDEYKDKMPVTFVNVRLNPVSPGKFGVRYIPTQVFLDKNGKEYYRHIGFLGYDEIKAVLKKVGF